MPFATQGFERGIHQIHGTQSMVKTSMQSAGINQVRHAQLFDVSQPLKIGVCYQVEDQFGWDGDKAVYRIVYNFLFIQCGYIQCKNVKQR